MFFKFVKKALNENQTFIKFIFIGIINTIFGYGIYLLFLLIGFNFVIAALLSTILGIIFNFFTTGRFVFKSTNNYLLLKFVMVYIFIYLFTIYRFYKGLGEIDEEDLVALKNGWTPRIVYFVI